MVVGGSIGGGPPRGVPATPAMAEANRTKAWKHGLYAKTVTELEVRGKNVGYQLRPDAPDIIEGFHGAFCDGDMEALAGIDVSKMAEGELRRRDIADRINKDGVVLEEAVMGPFGPIPGVVKIRAHPLLEHEKWIREQMGATATDTMLTKKSRGDATTNLLLAAAVARDAAVRRADKTGLAAVDVTLFEED